MKLLKPTGVQDLRILPKDKEKDAYRMAATCLNCAWSGNVLIPKGSRAPRRGLGEFAAYCKSCGCRALVVSS